MHKNGFRHLVMFSILLALLVVMLGAYTRLTNAGLGCPDWPGCYGHIIPNNVMEATKAWTEMIHRYAAGTLALCIFTIAGLSFYKRFDGCCLALALLVLVCFQAALGMWTVTLKLLPVVVMGHLLGGILIFSFLCCLRVQLIARPLASSVTYRGWVIAGAVIVFCQIALGGWVSANYAGLGCIGFPRCNGQWIPDLHLSQGFYLFSQVGENYQGGVLDHPIRATIQYIHRLGAIITFIYLYGLAWLLWRKAAYKPLKYTALVAVLLVSIQFCLGVMNVVYLLPLKVAVAHNGIAAMLMASLLIMVCLGRRSQHD